MRFVIWLAAFGPLLAGCAVTAVDGQRLKPRSDAFAAYVEAVFRRQNDVATALLFALEDAEPDSPRYAELEAAEGRLLTACRGLNEIAQARRDEAELGGFAALKRARQAPDCERATLAAETTLASDRN